MACNYLTLVGVQIAECIRTPRNVSGIVNPSKQGGVLHSWYIADSNQVVQVASFPETTTLAFDSKVHAQGRLLVPHSRVGEADVRDGRFPVTSELEDSSFILNLVGAVG